ncbi:MAG TPA: DUF305 domain-containing protein [Nevskiaceae bacterium]|nr:DUF305 domain-containing protein [Nevskiaceae bacterium]
MVAHGAVTLPVAIDQSTPVAHDGSEQRPHRRRRRQLIVRVATVGVAFALGYGLGAHFAPAPRVARGAVHRTAANPHPNAADIGFCQDMILHHKQAVLMAMLALDRATPTVRTLAKSILSSQSREIGVMGGWLALWGAPQGSAAPMVWMSAAPAREGMHRPPPATASSHTEVLRMPGMATGLQLGQLQRDSSRAFDILFMQLMIRHHQGGIAMARAAMRRAATRVVRHAARAMVFEQAREIALMTGMLRADGAQPLPAPQ